jgi:hypothetical protein
MDREVLMAAICSRPIPFTLGGLPVYLRALKIGELAEMLTWEKGGEGRKWYQIVFVRSVCDASGNRLFTDDDASVVAGFDAAAVQSVVNKADEMNWGRVEGKADSLTTPS